MIVKDLNKTETYDISDGVSIAPLAAPAFNSHGIYDVYTLDENFLDSYQNYKDFYYDFIIGSDGQLKIILGYCAQ